MARNNTIMYLAESDWDAYVFSTVSRIMIRRVGSCTLTGGVIVPIYDAYLFLDVSCRVVVSLYIV